MYGLKKIGNDQTAKMGLLIAIGEIIVDQKQMKSVLIFISTTTKNTNIKRKSIIPAGWRLFTTKRQKKKIRNKMKREFKRSKLQK